MHLRVPPVATCILARNAADALAAAIESVKPLGGSIWFGDLGSDDASSTLAADAGAQVVPIPWQEDFAAARNSLVDKALTNGVEWVLWLNASERLLPESVRPLMEVIGRPEAAAAWVRIRNQYPDGMTMTTGDIRLWRRHAALSFVGRLHPHLHPQFKEAIAREGRAVLPSDAVLLNIDPHHGESLGQTQHLARLRFNARLLELELRDRPGQLHYQIQFGRVLLALGDTARGHEVMRLAAREVAANASSPAPPVGSVQDLLAYLVRSSQTVPGHESIPRPQAAELAIRWFPKSPSLLSIVAEAFFAVGQYQASAAILEQLLQLGQTGSYDSSSVFDPGLLGDDARINLAACYRRLGRTSDAARLYRRLLSSSHYAAQARDALTELGEVSN
jgi:hypothetical protein